MTLRHAWWIAPAGLFVAAGIWVLRTFDPNAPGNPFFGCVFLKLTGWYCPGCGSTRALHALVHFDPWRALEMNALLVIGAPIGGLLALRALAVLPAWSERWLRPIAHPWGWAALVLAFGVLRNLAWPPFAWLAPG
jgi:hypothetical protein